MIERHVALGTLESRPHRPRPAGLQAGVSQCGRRGGRRQQPRHADDRPRSTRHRRRRGRGAAKVVVRRHEDQVGRRAPSLSASTTVPNRCLTRAVAKAARRSPTAPPAGTSHAEAGTASRGGASARLASRLTARTRRQRVDERRRDRRTGRRRLPARASSRPIGAPGDPSLRRRLVVGEQFQHGRDERSSSPSATATASIASSGRPRTASGVATTALPSAIASSTFTRMPRPDASGATTSATSPSTLREVGHESRGLDPRIERRG